MKLNQIGEFKLIEKLVSLLPIDDKDVVVGFGDDCACINVNGKLLLFTNDIQVENRHFIKELQKPENIGWKLISVNVSDVLACGGIPRWSQISLGLPKNLEYSFIEEVYIGIKKALDYYGFYITGGNVSSSNEIILDLFLVGETEKFLSRKDAQEGDYIYINGFTGLARAGLELLLMEKKEYEDFEKELIRAFTKPTVDLSLKSLLQKNAKACIDISDGLVADLGHISKQSDKKIVLFKEKLPVNTNLKKYCKKYSKNIYDYILYGGEDYVIAFSCDKELKHKNIYKIGKVEQGKGIYLKEDKKITKLKVKGFEHL